MQIRPTRFTFFIDGALCRLRPGRGLALLTSVDVELRDRERGLWAVVADGCLVLNAGGGTELDPPPARDGAFLARTLFRFGDAVARAEAFVALHGECRPAQPPQSKGGGELPAPAAVVGLVPPSQDGPRDSPGGPPPATGRATAAYRRRLGPVGQCGLVVQAEPFVEDVRIYVRMTNEGAAVDAARFGGAAALPASPWCLRAEEFVRNYEPAPAV